MRFDSVQLGSPDLASAAARYADLLGIAPVARAADRVRFQLERGAVELEPGEPGVRSIRFALQGDVPPGGEDVCHGLTVHFDASAQTTEGPRAPVGAVSAIDHVVIHSPNLDRALQLWRDRLGVRLALDREFPGRGLRMLFFRSGGVTLEFVSPLAPADDPGAPDRFFGIAFRVRDLAACVRRLTGVGFDVSAMRPGHKSGTTVATVRSDLDGTPTLLIEDPSRDG
jgi:catechol 2,3-dioxygenase-like lactoylglutathione lyase family enzyme